MRFEVGELARFVVARTSVSVPHVGHVVEVIQSGVRKGTVTFGKLNVENADYLVRFSGDVNASVMDWQLQKLNPPEEPVEMTHHEEVEA